jgi:hypothetical protein
MSALIMISSKVNSKMDYGESMFMPKVFLCQKVLMFLPLNLLTTLSNDILVIQTGLRQKQFMPKACVCQKYVYAKSMLVSNVCLSQKYVYVKSVFVPKVCLCQK